MYERHKCENCKKTYNGRAAFRIRFKADNHLNNMKLIRNLSRRFDIYHDIATKLEVLKKKLILPFTGTATVKLYDSLTGKQTYEAKSENRISAIFGNTAYLDWFYYPMQIVYILTVVMII